MGCSLVEELCKQSVTVRMLAYLQNGIEQLRYMYRTSWASWRQLDFRFCDLYSSSMYHRHLHRCHRYTCDDCLIHSFIFYYMVNTRTLAVRWTTRALRLMLPVRQGFRGKYRSTARMIFSETTCGPTLLSDKKHWPTLPCSSSACQWLVFSLSLSSFISSFLNRPPTKRAVREGQLPQPILQYDCLYDVCRWQDLFIALRVRRPRN